MCVVTVRGPCAKDLYGYAPKMQGRYLALMDVIRLILERKMTEPIQTLVSCGLQGSDWIFHVVAASYAEEHAGTKVLLYEPFIGVHQRWKECGLFSKSEYLALRREAQKNASLKVLCEDTPASSDGYRTLVQETYAQMMAQADVVLCIVPWKELEDGLNLAPGPVKWYLRENSAKKQRLILIHPETLHIKELDGERRIV